MSSYRRTQPNKHFTSFLYNNFLNKRNGFFIEAGANTGYGGSVCWHLEMDYGWTGINIEPNPYCFAKLVKKRPRCKNYRLALSDKVGHAEFILPVSGPRKEYSGGGSLKVIEEWAGVVERFSVDTERLDAIVSDSVDLLVLDVEGGEIEALAGMGDLRPKVICVEDNKVNKQMLDLMLPDYHKSSKRYKANAVYLLKGDYGKETDSN